MIRPDTLMRQFDSLPGVTRLRLSQSSNAPYRPVVMPAGMMPDAARGKVYGRNPRDRTRSTLTEYPRPRAS